MNKKEMLVELAHGRKITHRHFSDDEWMKFHVMGKVIFEDGCICSLTDFWLYRSAPPWNTDWSVIK